MTSAATRRSVQPVGHRDRSKLGQISAIEESQRGEPMMLTVVSTSHGSYRHVRARLSAPERRCSIGRAAVRSTMFERRTAEGCHLPRLAEVRPCPRSARGCRASGERGTLTTVTGPGAWQPDNFRHSPSQGQSTRIWTSSPYTPREWRSVRKGWWWHLVATVLLLPYWALVAWTIWQKPGGASLGRRIAISVVMVVGALLLIPLVFIIPWTRRWYWFWRTSQNPTPGIDPNAPLDHIWARITSKPSPTTATAPTWPPPTPAPASPPATQPPAAPGFRDPWLPLVSDAIQSQQRCEAWLERTPPGPGRDHLTDIAEYVDGAAAGCHQVARRGQMIEDGIGDRPAIIARRLQAAETEAASPGASTALVETIKSFKSETASLQRMQTRVNELRAELERLCAQLSALVTQALEMTWITLDAHDHARLSDDLSRLLGDFDSLQGAFESLRPAAR